MRPRNLPLEFRRFLVVGAGTTGIQYLVLIIGVEALGTNATAASTTGFALSAIVNYLLNYRYTFASSASHLVAASRFVAISTFGLGMNAVLMWLLTQQVQWPYVVAQLIATVCVPSGISAATPSGHLRALDRRRAVSGATL